MIEGQFSSRPPQLPPMADEERFSWLRLLRSRRVGVATFHRLLAEYGSAEQALAALPDIARAAGVPNYEICPPGVIEAEIRAARAAGARLVCLNDPLYPAALAGIDEAPPLLWAIGRLDLLARAMLAIVGARNASSLGTRMARGLARELGAQGFVTVSGLARGIDAAAHGASLDSGTIAVVAGGVDTVYPAENARLREDIAREGLILSEQPMGMAPQARHFPRRNRIISGLAQGVVVVEAAAKSGSLITARDALDQGREVLAVPGHPFDARAAGCNMLIRDGAQLVRNAADVVAALPAQPMAPAAAEAPQEETPQEKTATPAPPPPRRSLRETAALHRAILARLSPSPLAEDQLIRDMAMTAGELGPTLVDLEIEGRIRRQPGGLVSLGR